MQVNTETFPNLVAYKYPQLSRHSGQIAMNYGNWSPAFLEATGLGKADLQDFANLEYECETFCGSKLLKHV